VLKPLGEIAAPILAARTVTPSGSSSCPTIVESGKHRRLGEEMDKERKAGNLKQGGERRVAKKPVGPTLAEQGK
jgi:hypothetical protein